MESTKSNRISARYLWIGVGFLLLAAGLYLILSLTRPYTYHGTVIVPQKPAQDISLPDTHGQLFDLNSQKGNIVLLFFGYTYCPDECPATLAVMKQVMIGLGDKADLTKFVFVTVDPDRDTPSVLQAYLEKYNPAFIGITGSLAQLQPVWQDYGVYVQKIPGTTVSNYTVSHSTNLYLIDQTGNVSIIYSYGTAPDDIVRDLLHMLG